MSGNYGKSIMIPEVEKLDEIIDTFPESTSIDDDTLAELKSANTGRVKAIKTLDPSTGIMGSGEIMAEGLETISEILDDTDREKRHFNNAGIHDIKSILRGEVPEGLISELEQRIDQYTHIADFKAAIKDPNILRQLLGPEICTEVSRRILVNDTPETILTRVALKLFESYRSNDAIYNDISELQRITQTIYASSSELGDTPSDADFDKLLKNMQKITNTIGKLESHEEKMKLPRYDIHDMDIRLIDEIRETYEYALSFDTIKKSLADEGLCRKYKLDLTKNRKAALNRIEGWVSELVDDDKVVYTFPTTSASAFDTVTHKSATAEFIQYMSTALIRQHLAKYAIDTEEASSIGLIEFYIKKGYIDQAGLDLLNDMTVCFAYMLSRSFKYKSIIDTRSRRVLSYTLDFISKSMTPQYRVEFYDIVSYVYNKIMTN